MVYVSPANSVVDKEPSKHNPQLLLSHRYGVAENSTFASGRDYSQNDKPRCRYPSIGLSLGDCNKLLEMPQKFFLYFFINVSAPDELELCPQLLVCHQDLTTWQPPHVKSQQWLIGLYSPYRQLTCSDATIPLKSQI